MWNYHIHILHCAIITGKRKVKLKIINNFSESPSLLGRGERQKQFNCKSEFSLEEYFTAKSQWADFGIHKNRFCNQ